MKFLAYRKDTNLHRWWIKPLELECEYYADDVNFLIYRCGKLFVVQSLPQTSIFTFQDICEWQDANASAFSLGNLFAEFLYSCTSPKNLILACLTCNLLSPSTLVMVISADLIIDNQTGIRRQVQGFPLASNKGQCLLMKSRGNQQHCIVFASSSTWLYLR